MKKKCGVHCGGSIYDKVRKRASGRIPATVFFLFVFIMYMILMMHFAWPWPFSNSAFLNLFDKWNFFNFHSYRGPLIYFNNMVLIKHSVNELSSTKMSIISHIYIQISKWRRQFCRSVNFYYFFKIVSWNAALHSGAASFQNTSYHTFYTTKNKHII